MQKPICFHLEGFQVEQYRDDFEALESRFTNFWSGMTDPTRLITRVRRFSFEPVRQRFVRQTLPLDDVREILALFQGEREGSISDLVRKRAAIVQASVRRLPNAPALNGAIHVISKGTATESQYTQLYAALQQVVWPWRWAKNYRRMYDVLEQLAPPLTIEHYLLTWPQEYLDASALAGTLRQTFLLPDVTVAPLPPLFRGQYRPTATYLRPLTAGQPYLRVLHAFDTRGIWDFRSFRELLMGEHELAIAMDITTLDAEAADKATTNAFGTLQLAVHGRYATKDPRAERALRDVDYAMHVLDQQNLHEVAFYLLIQAPTMALLEKQTHALRATFGKRLSLDTLAGAQEEYLKMFTPTPAKQIAAPIIRRNCLSEHIAAKTPWGIRKTNRLVGPFWGYDPHENMPIHYDTFGAKGDENAHLVAWAKSGFGKTVFMGSMATRLAVAGHQVIVFDPVGKVRRTTKAIGPGAAYYRVKTQSAINILDPVEREHYRQLGHVIRKLSIILGRVILKGDGDVDYIAREITNLEFGALDQACQHPAVYGPKGHKLATMTAADAPLLENLVHALREVDTGRNGAAQLAEEIVSRALYSFGHIYNAPTTLKWDFDHDMVGYNFAGADKLLLPLYYDHAFGSINSYLRSPERRRRNQHLIVMIDEFRYMAQVPALRGEVAMATKTWRNENACVWLMDQNAMSMMGGSSTSRELSSYITNNTNIRLIGRQEGDEAELVAQAFRGVLSETHIQKIRTAGIGEFVGIFGAQNEVHYLNFQPTDLEGSYFLTGNDDPEEDKDDDDAR